MIRIPIPLDQPVHPRMARFMTFAASQGENVDFVMSNLGVAVNRNKACKQLLDSKDEYLWMVDSDVIPPGLMGGTLPILSGVYHHYLSAVKQIAYSAWVEKGGNEHAALLELPDKIFVAHTVGAGCIRIHRSVLEKIGSPWFEDHLDKNHELVLGEDFDFCKKARANGERIMVDPAFLCHHLKTVSIKTFLTSTRPEN